MSEEGGTFLNSSYRFCSTETSVALTNPKYFLKSTLSFSMTVCFFDHEIRL